MYDRNPNEYFLLDCSKLYLNIIWVNAAPSEITTVACDKKQDRLDMANLFNEVKSWISNLSQDDIFQY